MYFASKVAAEAILCGVVPPKRRARIKPVMVRPRAISPRPRLPAVDRHARLWRRGADQLWADRPGPVVVEACDPLPGTLQMGALVVLESDS